MSIFPPSNAFLVLTRFATFLLKARITKLRTNTQLEEADSGSAWRSAMLAQNGTEWNDQGCSVVGGTTTVGGRSVATGGTCVRLQLYSWLQQQDHLHNITMQISIAGLSFFLLIPLLFDGVMMASQCCMCKHYNACGVSLENQYFYFISKPKQLFLFLNWHCLLNYMSYFGCSKHHVPFSLKLYVTTILMCFMLVYHFYAYYRYSGCHAKISNFNAEKFDLPHIAPPKNYFKPKNYLDTTEWQYESWNGNR